MNEQPGRTPGSAEGERDDAPKGPITVGPTPGQAEGERDNSKNPPQKEPKPPR